MLRFRSFYKKLILIVTVGFCFLFYTKFMQVEDKAFHESLSLQHSNDLHTIRSMDKTEDKVLYRPLKRLKREKQVPGFADKGQENITANKDPHKLSNSSTFEASIRLDLEKQEPGLGDNGEAAFLYGAAKEHGEAIYRKIALNEELSERLSYNRTVGDARHPACIKEHYDVDSLPTTSVIIPFYNEPYSVVIRTIHSTLNTCHSRLLKEIILVDDGSSHIELGGKLDYYISSRLPKEKIHLLRLKNQLGLIRARLAGARNATGDVLIFLDAHCEGSPGWSEPLLSRIKESRTSVVVPIIDDIDSKDFHYNSFGYRFFHVGGFNWSGVFDWISVPPREKTRQLHECKKPREICPTYSPTMAGGLFAIDRHYFWEIGSYDEQMDGWGGENLEISFRIWQCGGTIETIPCSRVGHVYRKFRAYKFPQDRDTHGINTARMALVWMDDYVNIFFLNRPDLKFHPDIGVMLRKKLRCKSFDWYLKNIYPEKFIPTKNVIAYGRIKSENSNLCLDDLLQNNEQPYNLGVFSCSKTLSKSQFFSFTKTHVLRNELSCATASISPPHIVVMVPCLEQDDENDKWQYINGQFMHIKTHMCLDDQGLKDKDTIRLASCNKLSKTQRWTVNHDDFS